MSDRTSRRTTLATFAFVASSASLSTFACSRSSEPSSAGAQPSTTASAAPSNDLGKNARRLIGTWVRNIDDLLASEKFQQWLATAADPALARKQVVLEASQTKVTFRADGRVTREDPPPAPTETAHWKVVEDAADDVEIVVEDKESVRFHFMGDDRMTSDDGKVWVRVVGNPQP